MGLQVFQYQSTAIYRASDKQSNMSVPHSMFASLRLTVVQMLLYIMGSRQTRARWQSRVNFVAEKIR